MEPSPACTEHIPEGAAQGFPHCLKISNEQSTHCLSPSHHGRTPQTPSTDLNAAKINKL